MNNQQKKDSSVLNLLTYWQWLKKQDRTLKQATDSDKESLPKEIKNAWTLYEFRKKLAEFLEPRCLTLEESEQIVDQALILLRDIYVHLPLKQSLYAVNPTRRLQLLKYHLRSKYNLFSNNKSLVQFELWFHNEMLSIFTELRDLHTTYILPEPFQQTVAFLPFLIEEYEDKNKEMHYVVSRISKKWIDNNKSERESLHQLLNATIIHWNGIDIKRAIQLNANLQAGSNEYARHARGLNAMTFRPLGLTFTPDEDWVVVGYKQEGSDSIQEIRIDWQVVQLNLITSQFNPFSLQDEAALALGVDALTEAIQSVRDELFAEEQSPQYDDWTVIETKLPRNFRAYMVGENRNFGYIRIWSFMPRAGEKKFSDVQDGVEQFCQEFQRLLKEIKKQNNFAGLIIDIRGNGGGSIIASHRILQKLGNLVNKQTKPVQFHFRNTQLTLQICQQLEHLQKNSQQKEILSDKTVNEKRWLNSIEKSLETGEAYSQGFPLIDESYNHPIPIPEINEKEITEAYSQGEPIIDESDNQPIQAIKGKNIRIALLVDALCYSAADIFAAEFVDNKIGKIIGTQPNTGAGGANVWTHALLQKLLPDSDTPIQSMAYKASFLVAVRRSTRVSGKDSGNPIEDLGVAIEAENVYRLTKEDVKSRNKKLIEDAIQKISQ